MNTCSGKSREICSKLGDLGSLKAKLGENYYELGNLEIGPKTWSLQAIFGDLASMHFPEVFWNISLCTPLNSYVIWQVIYLRFTVSYKRAFSSRLRNLNSVYFGMNVAYTHVFL